VDELAAKGRAARPIRNERDVAHARGDDDRVGVQIAARRRDAPTAVRRFDARDRGSRLDAQRLVDREALEVPDVAVARDPPALGMRDRPAGQRGQAADRVQAQAVVAAAPRGRRAFAALQHDRVDPEPPELGRRPEARGAGADHDHVHAGSLALHKK
jgi:hypothetical protein